MTIQLVAPRHPALHRRAERIEDGPAFKRLAAEMIDYCQEKKGRTALAAPQVGRSVALIVTREGQVVINPSIRVDPEDRTVTARESCLSLPNRTFLVDRFIRCYVEAETLDHEHLAFEAHGFNARLWQHEAGHLDGVLISDHWPEVSER